jgi:hypothetical protein
MWPWTLEPQYSSLQSWNIQLNGGTCTQSLVSNGQTYTVIGNCNDVANNYICTNNILTFSYHYDHLNLITLKQSSTNTIQLKQSNISLLTVFINLLPKCKIVNINKNEWKHKGCNLESQNNIYPCLSTRNNQYGWIFKGCSWKPQKLKYTCVEINNSTSYTLAAVSYNCLLFAVHIWNAETIELLHSCILNKLPCSLDNHHIRHVHLIAQRSTGSKSLIIVFSKSWNESACMCRYKLNGKCIQQQTTLDYIYQIKSQGQIGIILLEDGQLQIMNWLTFQIILTIKTNCNGVHYLLSFRDLYHILPANEHQFDYQPQISVPSLPCAVIICGHEKKLYIYHVRLNEYKLVNTIELDRNTSIKCMDMFRGD